MFVELSGILYLIEQNKAIFFVGFCES